MNKRIVCLSILLFISLPAAVLSRVYLQPGEAAVNVGLLVPSDARDITATVVDEYEGVLVREVSDIGLLSFVVPEERVSVMSAALSERVRYVEPDRLRYIPELPSLLDHVFVPHQVDGDESGGGVPLYYPNDPRYGQQWGPQAIDAQRAWNHVPQNHDVILAIVDTGVDVSHEDLTGNYDPAIDKDIVNNDNNANDDAFHGTHCAGIGAAVTNNSTGIAGLAQVTIMGVKVLDWLGTGTDSDIAAGINYAANNGADVISLSLGGTGYSSAIHNACDNAFYNNNVVVVAAAGNSNTSQKTYPAAHASVIGVAALETPTQRADFSNYGFDNVEISAPGVAIHSTLPDHLTFWNLFGLFPFDYGDMDGTSMACPHVAGVAAGYRAYNQNLSAQTVRNLLNNWADDLGDPYYFGSGRVDYFPLDSKSASVGEQPDHHVSTTPADTESIIDFLRYRSVVVEIFDEDMREVASYRRFLDEPSHPAGIEQLPEGTYHYQLRAGDRVSGTRMVTLEK